MMSISKYLLIPMMLPDCSIASRSGNPLHNIKTDKILKAGQSLANRVTIQDIADELAIKYRVKAINNAGLVSKPQKSIF